MATIGLSKPYFAVYSASGNSVTYSNGGLIGKYTEMSIAVDASDANKLFADNALVESDKAFAGGTFSITTDELDAGVMKSILGLVQETITTSGVLSSGAKWDVFDGRQSAPYLGIGGVIKKRVGGVDKYVAFVLDKAQFDNPSISAVTQGESIDWQTQQLTATIMRSDANNNPWFRISTPLNSEAEAEAAVKGYLSIT